MSTMSNYRPSKRPSVSKVEEWELLYSQVSNNSWRSELSGRIEVWNGYPFPDFYKVVFYPEDHSKKKTSKLFYGESAHHEVYRYVSDLGFSGVMEVIL